jgi:dTDP-glucose pyrophosphorylase
MLAHKVDQPRQFGIAFLRPDGALERLVEKPDIDGTRLANIGAYLFPRTVFEFELMPSPRGEYEITDYVNLLAARQPVQVVPAQFWLPIGNVEAWQAAETADLSKCIPAK